MSEYTPPPLSIKCRLIPIIHSIRKLKIVEEFKQIDAWAVPIHKVVNLEGKFRSQDLKDYLGLPSYKKLILSTNAPDSFQEMLWRDACKEPDKRKLKFKKHKIDYWFPGHFSIYDNDSKLMQFANAKRQQLHALMTKSQFVWYRLGEHIPKEFLEKIRNAASVLISTNSMITSLSESTLRAEINIAEDWFSPKTTFFILGGLRHASLRPTRKCHEVNSTWLMRGLMGYSIDRKRLSGLKKKEVLIHNLTEALQNVYSTTFHYNADWRRRRRR